MLFQVPPATRFDLNFSLAGFTVRVHPLFWVIALLFGSSSGSVSGLIGWVIAMFVSILIHELGHALAFRRYGIDSEIILHATGGLTVPNSFSFSFGGRYSISANQQIIISLAGPFAGFLFAGLILVITILLGGIVAPTVLFGFLPFPVVYIPSVETF
ncbi:MAG: hypothetical protein IPL71_17960 [Anaerolineales bacterium]|uniref:site-2 protease family protein n=1 Tax=Candidatus Villigracilis proximus TaxID=3140683 RepID=UPI003137508C|nr:hypothetical protein [Anaerolineales bacterium]